VRLLLVVEGGFAAIPGLRRRVDVDVDALPPEQAQQVCELLDRADFFELPESIDPPPGAADYREYVLTADDGERCHTVRCPDFAAPPDLQALVELLDTLR
jgi:hypothetical protein